MRKPKSKKRQSRIGVKRLTEPAPAQSRLLSTKRRVRSQANTRAVRIEDETDVFVSYNCAQEARAASLASTLRKKGYTVWWARDLPATGAFRKEIARRLNGARAVVVIWSKESAESDWVCAEADHALRQGKLVNTHTRAIKLPSLELPLPFGQTQSVSVHSVAKIAKALDRLAVPRLADRGVTPSSHSLPAHPRTF
jgi:TIR domain